MDSETSGDYGVPSENKYLELHGQYMWRAPSLRMHVHLQ